MSNRKCLSIHATSGASLDVYVWEIQSWTPEYCLYHCNLLARFFRNAIAIQKCHCLFLRTEREWLSQGHWGSVVPEPRLKPSPGSELQKPALYNRVPLFTVSKQEKCINFWLDMSLRPHKSWKYKPKLQFLKVLYVLCMCYMCFICVMYYRANRACSIIHTKHTKHETL